MGILSNLRPESVFYYFEELCRIPHGSGNTKAISDYIVSFAKEHGLEYIQDEMNNVIIRAEASKGCEDAPGVILQGHIDMVCEKRPDIEHDFEKDGLELIVSDGFVRANGTTLGGDDGIAAAMMLAVLSCPSIVHPKLECVFTTDEEIGLLGAAAMDAGVLTGRRMINLDSEEEGILLAGCAGGSVVKSELSMGRRERNGLDLTIDVGGLLGGHSGAEIDKNRMNACLVMARFLYNLNERIEYGLSELEGGTKDNAIPRSCHARICISPTDEGIVFEEAEKLQAELRNEYAVSDPDVTITAVRQGSGEYLCLHPSGLGKVLFLLRNTPFGVQKMSGTVPGLVETSLNLGILKLADSTLVMENSVRSSIGSAKKDIQNRLIFLTEFLGGKATVHGDYPGWEYRQESPLRDVMTGVYKKLFGKEMEVTVIHAGLECGLFYDRLEGLDCVSIGPDIFDIHTSEEHLDIASTERTWNYLCAVLKALAR